MARKDKVHDIVKTALEKDGWSVIDEQMRVKILDRGAFIDMAAEKIFELEKDGRKIAVEVKSFLNISILTDVYHAIGQYRLYNVALKKQHDEDYTLYLAAPKSAYDTFLKDLLADADYRAAFDAKLIIFDATKEEIVLWIE
jgi:XisH protein